MDPMIYVLSLGGLAVVAAIVGYLDRRKSERNQDGGSSKKNA
jgi:hypothetical protein